MASTSLHQGGFCLEEVAALDLVAVLGLGEALHQLAVLVGDHHGAEVGEAGVQTGLGGQTTHITSHPLETLLRLNDSLQIEIINIWTLIEVIWNNKNIQCSKFLSKHPMFT